MAKTLKQIQSEVINDGFLDKLASNQQQYADLKQYPVLKKVIMLSSDNFIDLVVDELNRLGKRNTGGLIDDIQHSDIIDSDGGFEVDLGYRKSDAASKYYDYVNKGVKGTVGGPSSEYTFNNKFPNRAMAASIFSWMNKRRKMARNDDQKYNLSATQKKNKKVLKMVSETTRAKSLAYAVAVNIKKKGIKRTGFFDKAVKKQFGSEFSKLIGSASAGDIKVNIRQLNELINKEQSSKN